MYFVCVLWKNEDINACSFFQKGLVPNAKSHCDFILKWNSCWEFLVCQDTQELSQQMQCMP